MIGELSVRMVVPIDMKNLHRSQYQHRSTCLLVSCAILPERRRRAQHVLSQSPHHAVWAGSVSYNVRCAEDEADDQTDRCPALVSSVVPRLVLYCHILPPIMPPILAMSC